MSGPSRFSRACANETNWYGRQGRKRSLLTDCSRLENAKVPDRDRCADFRCLWVIHARSSRSGGISTFRPAAAISSLRRRGRARLRHFFTCCFKGPKLN